MTVVAWDGRIIAADKRLLNTGHASTTTKLRKIQSPGKLVEVLAWTGDQDSCQMVASWYEEGADPSRWPECQKDEKTWARLVIVSVTGVYYYERQPHPVKVEDPFMAWGAGRDYALAAMYLGKDAKEAVEIASLFDVSCGNGCDYVDTKLLW